MPQFKYKGITFAEGWSGTFEQFQSEFSMTPAFIAVEPKEKASEMKKVFKDLQEFNKANEKEAKQQ